MHRLLRHGMDIQAVWSVGHGVDNDPRDDDLTELLVFADRRTLEQLRKRDDLHEPGVAIFVVLDGDLFETAWGAQRLSGSLARWAWREVAPGQAYYDESHWAAGAAEAGTVVRVRRKAYLVWSRAGAFPSTT
jgi:hypothetical protein